MTSLLLSLAALLVGPLVVPRARRLPAAATLFDAFVMVVIGGFVFLHILPEALADGGWPALAACGVGLFAPILVERGFVKGTQGTRRVVIVVAILGLAAHALVDGMGLVDHSAHHHHGAGGAHQHTHSQESGSLLAWAVILHRIPVGISIWWIVPMTLGVGAAGIILGVTATATILGYFLGEALLTSASVQAMAVFQALLCGSLLHVVLHSDIPETPAVALRRRWHLSSLIGAVAAVITVALVSHPGSHGVPGLEANVPAPGDAFKTLALRSAPALVFAYLAVGLFHEMLPRDWIARLSRGGSFTQALRGVGIGLPLPVCSCGIVPLYRDFVLQGAGPAAAVAFLIATPELEIAAVLLTWEFMGPAMTGIRVAAAALLALAVGTLVGSLSKPRKSHTAPDTVTPDPGPTGPLPLRVLRFGFEEALDHTGAWILVGLGLSAMLIPYLDKEWLTALPAGTDVALAGLLGLPLYVCASGSTPLAAVFLLQGLSPGAVLAFLLTGPATNVATFGVLARLHGRRTAGIFALSVLGGALIMGWVVNLFFPSPQVPAFLDSAGEQTSWLQVTCLAILGGALLLSLLRQGTRGFIAQLFVSPVQHEGQSGRRHHDHARRHDTRPTAEV